MSDEQVSQPALRLFKVLAGHEGMISCLAWEPHGRVLASTAFDKTLRIWDAEAGKILKTVKKHSRNVTTLTWAPEGQALATAGDDRMVVMWSFPETEPVYILDEFEKGINSIAWSPNGKTLITAANSRNLKIWDATARKLKKQASGHETMTRHLSFSRKGEYFASTSDSNRIRVWKSGGPTLHKLLEGHSGMVNMTTWTPDDKLVSCGDDCEIRVWDVQRGRCLEVLDVHSGPVKAVSVSCDGRLMASKSWDQTLRLWRCDTWQPVVAIDEEYICPLPLLAFHPRDPLLASVGLAGQAIRIWELEIDQLSVASSDPRIFSYQTHELQMLRDQGADHLVSEETKPEVDSENGNIEGVSCPHCRKVVPEREVVRWQSHGYTSVKCPGCHGIVPLVSDPSMLSLREWAGSDHTELVILFSDVMNSTQLGNELGDEEMGRVRRGHFEKARDLINRFEGYEVKTIGDSFMVAFKEPVTAFRFALAFRYDTGHEAISIRIGLNQGMVDIEDNDLFGAAVNMAARLEAQGSGSEIWVSSGFKKLIDKGGQFANVIWELHKDVSLKGFDGVFELWST